MDPCLPSDFARGVHVFQASSRRLPGKHGDFDKVHNIARQTAADIAASCCQAERISDRCPFHDECGRCPFDISTLGISLIRSMNLRD